VCKIDEKAIFIARFARRYMQYTLTFAIHQAYMNTNMPLNPVGAQFPDPLYRLALLTRSPPAQWRIHRGGSAMGQSPQTGVYLAYMRLTDPKICTNLTFFVEFVHVIC